MEELDIGDVKFHISRPPRVDFPTYRRLQRLMLSPALGTRRGFFRGFTPAFLIAALVSFVGISLGQRPDYAFLVVNDGALMIDAPRLWLYAVGIFLLGAAAVYWSVLSRSRRMLRYIYEQRFTPILDAWFGEQGLRIRWGDTLFVSPWSVVDSVHEEKGVTYLIASSGVSLAFTAQAFSSATEYEAWVAFVRERQRNPRSAP
ncbi:MULTISPECIES: hypothetical protein [unclassified Dyella]|uniref:hypothetical protein n=1 Tax=unclassified Dyella TaxID=2634549 RepID=UPI000C83A82A|nr:MULTISPECIES: hypothetical protein [unclassified Dyella]MDR3446993.1 hypothetical protein [Dyella sp.]PMQ05866.1 hypothetical protein DyAD56_06370 [Dyella sp. AD56]